MEEIRDMIEGLTRLHPGRFPRRKHSQVRGKGKKRDYYVRTTRQRRPEISLATKHAVLMMLYGDLRAPDLSKQLMRNRDIVQLTGLSSDNISKIKRRYVRMKGDMTDQRDTGLRKPEPKEVLDFILAKDTLKKTAHMSLKAKSTWIEK